MTKLESRRRLKQKRKLLTRNPFRNRKRQSLQFTARLEPTTRYLNKSQREAMSSFHQRLPLDDFTGALIKMEILVLMEDKRSPCTVLSMTSALFASDRVKKQYAKAGLATQDDQLDMFSRIRLGVSASFNRLRGKTKESQEVKRRYEYVNAVRKLEGLPGASSNIITSWEEARKVLCEAFEFTENEPSFDESSPSNSKKDPLMEEFTQRINTIRLRDETVGLRPSQRMWQEVANATLSPKLIGKIVEDLDRADQTLARRLEDEYDKKRERDKSAALEEIERIQREKEAAERAASLMRPLTPEEQQMVRDAISGFGSGDEVIAQVGTDSIQRSSMETLRPGGWLSDEVIHYFLIMLSVRDEELCRQDPNRKRCHFFKSFFITKALNEGHMDPDKDGKFEYKNVKRWSKKVPGKNIFNLDKIFFPINQNNMHWVCAVIFMQKKRIQFYDSMGGDGTRYLEALFQYVKDEHQAKNGAPLPDEDEWELVQNPLETPQQRNGFDCGVFTCMFADFLSKDCPLVFDQSHITQCRERIAVSILKGQAIM